jgi:hypothetical protein
MTGNQKPRSFEVKDLVYLYNTAKKPRLTKKFYKPREGPCQVSRKISDFKYSIPDRNGKRQIVHIYRHKLAYNLETWTPQTERKTEKVRRRHKKFGTFPLISTE